MNDTPNIVYLNHNEHMPNVRAWLEAKAVKKKADADSRKADGVLKSLRAIIIAAMRGASVAKCGPATVSFKPERHNPGALTLWNGRFVPLTDLRQIVAANGEIIDVSAVRSWFGGSLVGADLSVVLDETEETAIAA